MEEIHIRKKEWLSVDPPKDVAATVLARYGEWTFPPVVGVLTTPTLRHDGSLLASDACLAFFNRERDIATPEA